VTRNVDPFGAMVGQLTSAPSQQKTAKVATRPKTVVLTLKKNGRVVSGTDVHKRALAMYAHYRTSAGLGGGIVQLLMPKDAKEAKRLQRDLENYELVEVLMRGRGDRQRARDPKTIQTFLAGALARAPSDRLSSWKAKHFLEWLIEALNTEGSDVYRFAQRTHPLLLEKSRTLRWWQNRVAELKKMSR
jgi:hypothetical protein